MTVHLLAAGPGDPGLWTVRAERLLGEARVVVCDRELIEAARPLAPSAVIEGVEGAAGAIPALLAAARDAGSGDGDGVVRLARGDRLLWEAGGAEATALHAVGVPVAVVPAVAAAFASPALAGGVPVMTRPLAATLTVVVGIDPPAVAGGTVVTEDGPDGVRPVVTGAVTALDLTARPAPQPTAGTPT